MMLHYEIILYWSERDRAFIAEVPELPGCAADGTTYREAVQNVETIYGGVARYGSGNRASNSRT